MAYRENIEKIFLDEVREKKRIGTGAFHMRGKGVKHGLSGALKTPFFYMSAKEKKKLNGEVKVSFMYETIIPKAEFDLKPIDVQKAMLIRWREIFNNDEIMKQMGIRSSSAFHAIVTELQIPRKSKHGVRKAKVTGENKIEKNLLSQIESEPVKTSRELELEREIAELRREIKDRNEIKPILITSGLHLEYHGDYDASTLNKIFTKMQLILDGEENRFNMALSLTEKV